MTKYDTAGAFEKLHEDPFLPASPDQIVVAAPRKSKGLGWVAAGIAAALVAGGIGIAASQDSVAENLGRESAPVAASVIENPTTDYTQALALNDQVVAELEAASTSSTPDEMADHIYNAADLAQQEATAFSGNPTVAGYISSASVHMTNSADAVTVGDFGTGVSEMNLATSDINAATAAL